MTTSEPLTPEEIARRWPDDAGAAWLAAQAGKNPESAVRDARRADEAWCHVGREPRRPLPLEHDPPAREDDQPEIRAHLDELLERLPDREFGVTYLRSLGWPLRAIAQVYGISAKRAHEILARAVARLSRVGI